MAEPSLLRDVLPRGPLRVPLAPTAPFATADAKPPGTLVRRGEPLADVPPSAPAVLAPISGVTGAVELAALTTGRSVPAVWLDAISESDAPPVPSPDDGEARLRRLLADAQPARLSAFIDAIRLGGVWAARWTSPDLLGQLHQCLKRPVDIVVCSTLDFDDALPLQQTVACAYPLEIVAAVAALGAATGATRTLIALDTAADGACARAFERWTILAGVRAHAMRNNYPQPNPTLLLRALAGRSLAPGRLPTDAGAVVLDAVAAAAVGRRLLFGEPLLRTPVGIADMRDGDGKTYLLNGPVGMSMLDVLAQAGVKPGAFELRAGSPLREVQPGNDCVVSAGGEVALYLVAPQPLVNPDPCIRCGWCVSGCPMHIHPAGLLQAAQSRDSDAAQRYGLEGCIECGICSYVCPSRLPILEGIRSLRAASRTD